MLCERAAVQHGLWVELLFCVDEAPTYTSAKTQGAQSQDCNVATIKILLFSRLQKSQLIQKMIDANGNLNAFTNEELSAAGIDDSCNISPNAHENHEWPTYPVPEQEGVDDKELEKWEELLEEGTWPDGYTPEKRESMQKHANGQRHPQTEDHSDAASDDKYDKCQARHLITSLSRALKRSCRLGYSNDKSLCFTLWQEVKPLLLPNISHLF